MNGTTNRATIKNALKGRTCDNCNRNPDTGRRRRGTFCQLYSDRPTMNICSQWMMGPNDRREKFVRHKERIRAKRKVAKEKAKLATIQTTA